MKLTKPSVCALLLLVFIGAFIFSWLRLKSGSIVGSWLMHASGNITMALRVAVRSAT